jgi:hypothetical protein
MTFRNVAKIVVALFASLFFTADAFAQDASPAGSFLLELNKVDMNGGNCFFAFVIYNTTSTSLKTITYNLSLFDQNGQIATTVATTILPMAKKQARTKTFGLPLTCNGVTGIIAETTSCIDVNDQPSTICDEAVFRSRVKSIQFPWLPQIEPAN